MFDKSRQFLRIICLIVSLYLTRVECGVDFTKCSDNTFSTDCACSGPIGICQCLKSTNSRSGWLCTQTLFGDSVSLCFFNRLEMIQKNSKAKLNFKTKCHCCCNSGHNMNKCNRNCVEIGYNSGESCSNDVDVSFDCFLNQYN